MAEAAENPITPTGLLGHAGTTDVGTVTPPAGRTLLNVADGATANSSDTALRDRSTHTGTQATSTVTGLDTALAGKAPTSHTHTLANITDAGTLAGLSTVGTAQLTNDAVTLAKIQNAVANSKLLGSGAAGAGADYAELTLGTNLSMAGTTLNATGGGGLPNAVANSKLLGSGAAGAGVAYSELTLGTNLTMAGNTLNAAATAASDSETVSFLFPATGSVTRTAESKLSDDIDIRDFGAVMGGAVDDTAALQKAIDYAELAFRGAGRSVINIRGVCLLDPATLIMPTVGVTLQVNGQLTLKSTLVLNRELSLVGVGGYNSGMQFYMGPGCVIQGHASLTGETVQMLEYSYMEGAQVYGQLSGKAAILIGRRSTDPTHDLGDGTPTRQTATVQLHRIGAEASGGASAAIKIENTFWVWIDYFYLANSGGNPSLWIADSYYPGDNSNHSGLIDVRDGVMAGGGVQFGAVGQSYTGAIGGAYWFERIIIENALTPFIKFASGSLRSDLFVHKCQTADAISMPAFIDNSGGALVSGVYYEQNNLMIGPPPWTGSQPKDTVKFDGFFPSVSEGNYHILQNMPPKAEINLQGEVEVCNAFRGGDFAPQMLPAGAVHILPNQDPSSFTPNGSGMTVTGGQTAPDGSATAYRVQSTGAGSSFDYLTDQSAMTSHWVLYGAWVRAPSQSNRICRSQAAPVLRLIAAASAGGYWGDNSADTNVQQEIGAKYIHLMDIEAGWVFISDMLKYTATTGPAAFYVSIPIGATTGDLLIWRPFCLRLPRSAFSNRDARRILSSLSLVDVAAKPGTLSQLPNHTFRTGIGATAARPSASTVGAGAQWFDTTLNQPIWSNGTAWATATGAAPAIVSSINGQIETVAVKTYTLDIKAAAAYTINSLTTKTGAGSCTAAIQIDGTPVTFTGGGTSHTTTETEYTATAANSVAAGQTVNLVVSAISSATDLVFTLKTTS